jgi:hypothetical protein
MVGEDCLCFRGDDPIEVLGRDGSVQGLEDGVVFFFEEVAAPLFVAESREA